jgi:hypothetical protein
MRMCVTGTTLAYVGNIEGEGGPNTVGVRALRVLRDKLHADYSELTAVKGLRSSGAGPGRTQEVTLKHSGVAETFRREFDSATAKLSTETGLPYAPPAAGEMVAGIYRDSVMLTSCRFAMIDNGLGFALVPWTSDLERQRGRHISGIAQDDGGIAWNFDRKRGLGI